MANLTIYRVFCNEYTDTRMGASNPHYQIGKTCTSLEQCKKTILKFLKEKGRKKGTDFPEFEIKNPKWAKDFNPWILSIKSEKIKID